MAQSRAGTRSRARLWAWLAVATALAARVVVLAQLHDHPLLQPSGVLDDAEYFRLGARAAAGDWLLGPRAYYVSPLYIYFLGIVFKVAGAVALHARVAQVLLGAAAVALVGRGAGRLFGPRAEPFAAALAALTGVFAFNEILLLQSAIDPFLGALALERLAAAVSAPSRRRFLLAGIALGLLGLNRPNALPAAAVIVVVALVAAAAARSRAMTRDVALLAAGVAVALAPVALRNRAVTGEWVLVSSHGGLNLYIGNNPAADGTYRAPPGITPTIEGQTRDTRRVAEAAEGRPLTDSEVSEHFYRLALRFIRDEPRRAAALFVRKLALAGNRKDAPLNYSYAYWSQDEPTLLRALVVGPWLLVPLGLAGLFVKHLAPRAPFAVWASFIPAYALSLAVFFVASRYRLPLLVALCVTAGGLMEWACRSWRERPASGFGRVAAAAALASVIAFWPLEVDDGVASERTERIVHLVVGGRPDEARALLERTLPVHRDPGLLHYRVGRAYLDTGRPDLAAEHFEKSLAAAPEQGEVHLALGQALLALGRPGDAVGHLERAQAANVFADVAGVDLGRALVALGRREEARGVVASTPLLEDTDAPTALALADLARELDDAATALRFADDAVRRAPNLAAARETFGLALVQLGRAPEAIAALEEACRLDPSDPTAPYNLALLYARAGRFGEARRFAQRALELDPRSPHPRALLADLPPA